MIYDSLYLFAGQENDIPTVFSYSDVIIIWTWTVLCDAVRDAAGRETRAASRFLQGVRQTGVPVTWLDPRDLEARRDMAVKAGPDAVVAANCGNVAGLERRVVVVLQSGTPPSPGRADAEEWGRVFAMSRATAQLVIVRPPAARWRCNLL